MNYLHDNIPSGWNYKNYLSHFRSKYSVYLFSYESSLRRNYWYHHHSQGKLPSTITHYNSRYLFSNRHFSIPNSHNSHNPSPSKNGSLLRFFQIRTLRGSNGHVSLLLEWGTPVVATGQKYPRELLHFLSTNHNSLSVSTPPTPIDWAKAPAKTTKPANGPRTNDKFPKITANHRHRVHQ